LTETRNGKKFGGTKCSRHHFYSFVIFLRFFLAWEIPIFWKKKYVYFHEIKCHKCKCKCGSKIFVVPHRKNNYIPHDWSGKYIWMKFQKDPKYHYVRAGYYQSLFSDGQNYRIFWRKIFLMKIGGKQRW